ncbi:TPA: hypothetical protein HA244_05025 [Candidatus Micrarchaeota archaeon]|nr:hypothetical protein [Candidatus Micrarchaeota archaeon]
MGKILPFGKSTATREDLDEVEHPTEPRKKLLVRIGTDGGGRLQWVKVLAQLHYSQLIGSLQETPDVRTGYGIHGGYGGTVTPKDAGVKEFFAHREDSSYYVCSRMTKREAGRIRSLLEKRHKGKPYRFYFERS